MSASLGGLLKDYRLQKNLSQLEIAFALGWKDTSRLSRIEQGRVGNPTRKFVDRLMNAMELKDEERNDLLLIGGYLPTKSEINKIRQETDDIINNWPYSAVLYDFSWRIIHHNKAVVQLYKIDAQTEVFIEEAHPNLLEIVFNPNFTQNKDLRGADIIIWHEFLLAFLLRYRYAQRTRTKEKWYIDLIQRLMENELFRSTWLKTQKTKPLSVYNFGTVSPIINPKNSNSRLKIYFSMVPLLKDPRFELDFDTPADITTFKYFNQLSSQLS
ncbi:MAG: helix-turn-helix transcriptional regulator [bacterium]|nr:helix-turn-helix transcriptional regulator [bacterium]